MGGEVVVQGLCCGMIVWDDCVGRTVKMMMLLCDDDDVHQYHSII